MKSSPMDFPQVQFMRLTDCEKNGLIRMASDAPTFGRAAFGEAILEIIKADVMTLAQYDSVMGCYRHWLNWGFDRVGDAHPSSSLLKFVRHNRHAMPNAETKEIGRGEACMALGVELFARLTAGAVQSQNRCYAIEAHGYTFEAQMR